MKRLIYSAVSLLLFSSYALSQANEPSKEETNQRSRDVDLKSLDQRTNYHWANGTTATPTGRDAAPTAMEGSYMSHRVVNASIKTPSYRNRLVSSTRSYLQTLDQRKIYHWKDGTTATPTGHEATPVGGGYASLGRPQDDKPVSATRTSSGNNDPDQ